MKIRLRQGESVRNPGGSAYDASLTALKSDAPGITGVEQGERGVMVYGTRGVVFLPWSSITALEWDATDEGSPSQGRASSGKGRGG